MWQLSYCVGKAGARSPAFTHPINILRQLGAELNQLLPIAPNIPPRVGVSNTIVCYVDAVVTGGKNKS